MFFYFYDSFVNEKKFEEELTKAENRLIELGINGRIEKLSVLRNSKEIINEGIKQGAHTIVAVGDDKTFINAMNIAAVHNVKIGFIPLGKDSKFAKILGITDSIEACNILSKRLTKKVNLGRANQNYFIASITLPETEGLEINCNDNYTVSLNSKNSKLYIYNLGSFLIDKEQSKWKLFPTKNNKLYIFVSPQQKKKFAGLGRKKNSEKESVFPVKKIKITSKLNSIPVILDEQTTLKTPINVSIKTKKITLIVGRDRLI